MDDSPRIGRVGIGVVLATTVVLLLAIGGTVAWASAGDDDPPASTEPTGSDEAAASAATVATHDHEEAEAAEAAGHEAGRRRHRHDHPELPPYEERYGAASPEEQAAADQLQADVATSLAAFTDVDAAVAAGYQARANPRGPTAHYLNRDNARSGEVLDPSRPTGLVYTSGEGEPDPVLLGAFFIAPPGVEVPTAAGGIVVWHSHSRDCPGFFATPDEPCLDSRRMLHVWTADEVELTTRRRPEPIAVRVTDPFGAPFLASIERL